MVLSVLWRPGVAVSMRHTMDTHWFRFRESPTNASRLPRSLPSILAASNLGRSQPCGCQRQRWYRRSVRPYLPHAKLSDMNLHALSSYRGYASSSYTQRPDDMSHVVVSSPRLTSSSKAAAKLPLDDVVDDEQHDHHQQERVEAVASDAHVARDNAPR